MKKLLLFFILFFSILITNANYYEDFYEYTTLSKDNQDFYKSKVDNIFSKIDKENLSNEKKTNLLVKIYKKIKTLEGKESSEKNEFIISYLKYKLEISLYNL
jgi:hypothetical protein